MDDNEILDIVKWIIDKLKGKRFLWRVEGSANLRMQGMDVAVNDLDIATSKEGIKIFRETVKEFIVKDFYNEKIQAESLVLKLINFEVEINAHDDGTFDMLDKIQTIKWQGLDVPVLPLPYAKKFYEMIDRKDKVELIQKHLKS